MMNKSILLFALFQLPLFLYGQAALVANQIGKPVVIAATLPLDDDGTGLVDKTSEGQSNSGIINAPKPNPEATKTGFAKPWNLGFSFGLAQPSFTVGHPSNMKGYYAELVNSTFTPSVNLGRLVSKGNLSLMNCNLVLSYLRLKEDDMHEQRSADFDIKMAELLVISDFYVLNLLRANTVGKAPKILPFLRFGVGFGIGDYTIVNGNTDPKPVNFALPIGLGLQLELTEKTAIVFDYMSRVTFSDSLDGLTSPFGRNDWYGSGGIGLSFKLSKPVNEGKVLLNDLD
jgi:hypothetical protein